MFTAWLRHFPIVITLFCVHLFTCAAHAAKVGKFTYYGSPEKLETKTLTLPSDIVSMGECVSAYKMSTENSVNGGGASLFFIIDNSSSMYSQGNDQWGARFSVTRAIIDSVNRINPSCEIGLVVFTKYDGFAYVDEPSLFVKMLPLLQTEADPLMQFLDTWGSYMMLLKLNQTYQSAKIGSKTGFEILKYYLQTDTLTELLGKKYIGLKYVPNDPILSNPTHAGGTNITGGFQSAKYAMRKAIFPKERQFVIFFSDGDANMPEGYKDLQLLFVKGIDVPATFSLYLTPNDTVPQNIVKMTENIKNNNYSSSNKFSNLWSIRSDPDTLMGLIKKNIFPVIFSTITSKTPKKLSVNSIENLLWQNNAFSYDKLFALTGATTPFTYLLTCSLAKDSITPTDTVHIFIKDTLETINFSARLLNGSTTPDSTRLAYWNRELGFFVTGAQVNWIDDKLKSLTVRFNSGPLDTVYGYSDVSIDLLTTHSATPDKETLSLQQNGQSHTFTIDVAVGDGIAGDNILQHLISDTIIAVFRNPQLPLDTLRAVLIAGVGQVCGIKSGIYFDVNADGFVDSIVCAVQGNPSTVSDNLSEIADLISARLPSFRSFNAMSEQALSNGIALLVKENVSAPTTYITSQDLCVLSDTVLLKNGGLLLPFSFTFIDSVAPVIMEASLDDYLQQDINDELTVKFSEIVEPVSGGKPFLYMTPGGAKYGAVLSVKSLIDETGIFPVTALENTVAIVQGDSIWINAGLPQPVGDGACNIQDNPGNVKRPITVRQIKEIAKLTKAVYFDLNADGFIDQIVIGISGKKKGDCEKIRDALQLAPFRKFDKTGCTAAESGVILDVKENRTFPVTARTDEDVCSITDTIVLESTGEVLIPSSAEAQDSVAAVIVRARLVDSLKTGARDELNVWFSEKIIAPQQSIPFNYITENGLEYELQLGLLSHTDSTSLFSVQSIAGVESVRIGDSIWIDAKTPGNIADLVTNFQTNPENRKRLIEIKTIVQPFDLVLKISALDRTDWWIIEDKIAELDGIKQILNTVEKQGYDKYRGVMIFTLEPEPAGNVTASDRFNGFISLYDPVGNRIMDEREMVFDRQAQRCIYLWNGANEEGRKVGRGSYCAVVRIERFAQDMRISYPTETRIVYVKE